MNWLADALVSGGAVYASDDDPDLVRQAAPFSLKLMEGLLAERPHHIGLRTAAAAGFTQYGFAFVQQEADDIEETDLDAAEALRGRARRLYLRARDHGLRGLEVEHKGYEAALRRDPRRATAAARREDVPLLYWTAAAWAAAISLSKDSPDALGDLPIVESMLDRALALDESFDHGAIHGVLISFEASRSTKPGDPAARARSHFDRAVALSGGGLASPYVTLAEAVSVPAQDRAGFESLLKKALAIDPDARPEWRLANLVYQRRARWLLEHAERLILE